MQIVETMRRILMGDRYTGASPKMPDSPEDILNDLLQYMSTRTVPHSLKMVRKRVGKIWLARTRWLIFLWMEKQKELLDSDDPDLPLEKYSGKVDDSLRIALPDDGTGQEIETVLFAFFDSCPALRNYFYYTDEGFVWASELTESGKRDVIERVRQAWYDGTRFAYGYRKGRAR